MKMMNIILRKGRYALIDRGHEYVVACGFDETKPENQQWEQGMYYTHWNESEIKKMEDEIKYLQGFLASVEKKLSNERFVANAKPEIVENERKKKTDAESKINMLNESIAALKK